MVGWVGDGPGNISLHAYADADLAGCRATARSTTGVFFSAEGPDTVFPLQAVSKRPTAVSHSTPEAEIVATDHCVQRVALPALDLWDCLLERRPLPGARGQPGNGAGMPYRQKTLYAALEPHAQGEREIATRTVQRILPVIGMDFHEQDEGRHLYQGLHRA